MDTAVNRKMIIFQKHLCTLWKKWVTVLSRLFPMIENSLIKHRGAVFEILHGFTVSIWNSCFFSHIALKVHQTKQIKTISSR